GRRPGGGLEALPLGATGFVDVNMGVDQPGQEHLVGCQLDDLCGIQLLTGAGDADDAPVAHADLDVAEDTGSVGLRDEGAAAQNQIEAGPDAAAPDAADDTGGDVLQ